SSRLSSLLRSQESSIFAGVLTASRLPQPDIHPLDRSFRQSSGHGSRFLLPAQTSRFLTLTSRLRAQKYSMFTGVLTGSRLLHPRQALSSFRDRTPLFSQNGTES